MVERRDLGFEVEGGVNAAKPTPRAPIPKFASYRGKVGLRTSESKAL
jgi:hypothetical protein